MATILVVDDEPVVLNLIAVLLEHDKHQVITASNGIEALTLFQSYRVDLVITDITMPEMGGFELVERLYEITAPKKPNVIFISGYMDKTVPCGNTYPFVYKPFTIVRLREVVQQALNK